MKFGISEPEMITEAKATGRKRKLILEILLFILVFTVASTVESIPMGVAYGVYFATDETAIAAINEVSNEITTMMQNGEIPNYGAIISKITNVALDMPEWMMIVSLFATVLMTVVILLFCKLIQKRKMPSVGFRKGRFAKEYLTGAAIGILMISASFGIAALTNSFEITKGSFGIVTTILFLLGYLLQGMSEEVLCRGYFMVSIARKNKMWVAVIVNSVVFAALHLGNPGIFSTPFAFLNLILCGIAFSVYVLKRGDIWGACAMHSLWNFFQGNIFGVSVSGMTPVGAPLSSAVKDGMSLWNGGAFGLEGSLSVTIVLIASILVFLFVVPEKREEPVINYTEA